MSGHNIEYDVRNLGQHKKQEESLSLVSLARDQGRRSTSGTVSKEDQEVDKRSRDVGEYRTI